MNPEDLQRLVTTQMPFGKYKGRLIADLPGHYLNWFAREGFPPGQIGRLLALMQELDHNGLKDNGRSIAVDVAPQPLRQRIKYSAATRAIAQVLMHGEPRVERDRNLVNKQAHEIRIALRQSHLAEADTKTRTQRGNRCEIAVGA